MFAERARLTLQNMTTLSRSLPLALLLSGLCAVPAMARDHRHKGRHDHGRHHHSHRYHHRPSISFGFYSNPYPYYAAPYYPIYPAPAVVYAPRPVYVDRGERSVEYDVQSKLARKGYYGGVIDGAIGSQTRAAIRAYQVDRGLPVSGRIDGALLRSLRLL
jgi:hypothetical protein